MLSLIITAYPSRRETRRASDSFLKKKLAACVKLSEVESSYWWKGKIVKDNETLVTIVTTKKNVGRVVSAIKREHPYTVPEIIEIPVNTKNKKYLEWACDVTK